MGGGGEADDPIQPVRNFSLLPGNINLIIGHPFQLPLHLSSSSTFNIDIARSTRGRGKKKKERDRRFSPTILSNRHIPLFSLSIRGKFVGRSRKPFLEWINPRHASPVELESVVTKRSKDLHESSKYLYHAIRMRVWSCKSLYIHPFCLNVARLNSLLLCWRFAAFLFVPLNSACGV